MASDIRLLEDLVNKAVGRLKKLSEERNDLQNELEALRQRLQSLDDARDSAGAGAAAWQTQRQQVLTVLHDTLDELRGD